MEIDWDLVKKQTLWSYEDLIAKLQDVLAYPFVQQHYNHSMPQALGYASAVRRGYLEDRGDMAVYIDEVIAHLNHLQALEAGTYTELVSRVASRAQCAAFLSQTGLAFEELIQTLNYLLRWVLPLKSPLRELIDTADPVDLELLKLLKSYKITTNLDLLEACRTAAGRRQISSKSQIPEANLLSLVHKADLTRLAYVRGKTVRHLCGGGYDTLAALASAVLPEMEARMDAHYRTFGKSLADFKAVIPLKWMIGGAHVIPAVLDC